ncbi:hypothetical protein PVAG01_03271 [Phlyctema vagabunda]|uniref:Uncharacterized protein n=1 Tax=Phlyctema vagabunda TaxID=108571 RepID=A0ABR4PT18_9HELO
MFSKNVALALAMASAVAAAPNMIRRDDCQNTYSSCIAAGTPEVACSCTLTACLGEDNARNREFCATATASLPTSTGIPGGCNPAHPGSCPSSYFTYPTITATTPLICNAAAIARGDCTATAASVPTSTATNPCDAVYNACIQKAVNSGNSPNFSECNSLKFACSATAFPTPAPTQSFSSISGIPGGCNPAHPGSCPSSYFTYTTASASASSNPCDDVYNACIQKAVNSGNSPNFSECNSLKFACSATAFPTAAPSPSFTSIAGIPGGCNPAHPGSCPSSYFTYTTAAPSASAAPAAINYPSPTTVEGKTWTVANLTRYCGEDASGCDYNFVIQTAEETERCTVIRMPGSNAATESWYDQPCTTDSKFKVSWGYATEPGPAFAVMTVVDGKELAFFGVSNVNGNPVTPSSPFGSGQFGSIGPQPVYTY